MFLDEPEGKTLDELLEFLGSAAVMGTAISLRLKSGNEIDANLYYSQESIPTYLELFHPKQPIGEDRFKVATKEIVCFKLRRHGRSPVTLDKNGVPIAVMPIMILAAREVVLNGKIINPGVTAIHTEKMSGKGEIISYDEEE